MDDRRREQLEQLDGRLRAELARKDAASRFGQPARPRPATTEAATVLTPGRTTSGSPTSGFVILVVAGFLVWWLFLRGPSAPTPLGGVVPPPAAVPTARAAPATLLSLQGNGIKKSKPFTATGPWSLEYDYNCASFGMAGNFAVTVYGAGGDLRDVAVNDLAMRGHDTTQGYVTGELYLGMNSECSWSVLVTG